MIKNPFKCMKIIQFCFYILWGPWGKFFSKNSSHRATHKYAKKRSETFPDFLKNILKFKAYSKTNKISEFLTFT